MSKILVFVVAVLALLTLACSSQAQVEKKTNETSGVQVVKVAVGVDAPMPILVPRVQEMLAGKSDGAVIFTEGKGKYDIVYYPSTKALTVRVPNREDTPAVEADVKIFFLAMGQKDLAALNLDLCEIHEENNVQSKSRWECKPLFAAGSGVS